MGKQCPFIYYKGTKPCLEDECKFFQTWEETKVTKLNINKKDRTVPKPPGPGWVIIDMKDSGLNTRYTWSRKLGKCLILAALMRPGNGR